MLLMQTVFAINRITGEFTALKAGKYQVMSTTDSGLYAIQQLM